MSSTSESTLLARRRGEDNRPAIRRSEEFRRIEALPRRTHVLDLRELMTEWLRTPTGTMTLNFEQAWALFELYSNIVEGKTLDPGLLGHVEVGGGKTLITLLAPTLIQLAWNVTRPGQLVRAALVVPANLRNHKTLKLEVPFYGRHFNIYDWHEENVLSYQQLGRAQAAEELEKKMFNVLVFDEVHWIKNQNAAVSARILRYLERYPETIVVALSASLTKEKIEDFGHIARMSLGESSPLPLFNDELRDWGRVLNHVTDDEMQPGALRFFCEGDETPRAGFQRRLAETPGVIISREADLSTGLTITERQLKKPPPAIIGALLSDMKSTKKTPGEDIIVSGLEMSRHRKELVCGFFYRWLWPNNTPDLEWLAARKAWRKFVRWAIREAGSSNVAGLIFDSEKQVRAAVLAGQIECDENQWEDWALIKDRCNPQLQAVWVDEFLIDEIERWMDESKEPGIVWTQHNAILNKLRKRGRIVYGGGQDEIVYETKTCVASLDAHKEGKNLQAFSRNLFVVPPMSGLAWEQAIGRTHRQGQQASEVKVEVFMHSYDLWSAFRAAQSESAYVREIMGTKPRLERATIDIPTDDEVRCRLRQQPPDPLWQA